VRCLTRAYAQASVVIETLMKDFAKIDVPAGDRTLAGNTYSAGLAESPTDGSALEPLLRVADTHLYFAKQAGRARVANPVGTFGLCWM
jgi:PleD family two-component response regulator